MRTAHDARKVEGPPHGDKQRRSSIGPGTDAGSDAGIDNDLATSASGHGH
jgi:hypothetical protein